MEPHDVATTTDDGGPRGPGGSLWVPSLLVELEGKQRILIAGAGGGFDVFCGLPLYFGLRAQGKEVFLANLSFSDFYGSGAQEIAPGLAVITAATQSRASYFPELHLARWFARRGEVVPIYCFGRMGVQPLLAAYQALTEHLRLDAMHNNGAYLATPSLPGSPLGGQPRSLFRIFMHPRYGHLCALEGYPIDRVGCLRCQWGGRISFAATVSRAWDRPISCMLGNSDNRTFAPIIRRQNRLQDARLDQRFWSAEYSRTWVPRHHTRPV